MMESYTKLMVNKGFNISNECVTKIIYVVVPTEKQILSQMLPKDVQKQIKLQKHGYLPSKSFDVSKFLDLLQMKFLLKC